MRWLLPVNLEKMWNAFGDHSMGNIVLPKAQGY